jgi:ketosteroid isomerase-like protein
MFRLLLLLVLFMPTAESISAEEIDIVTCDVLPVVEVRVSGVKFHFLIDTAATSILNIKSFAVGETKTIPVTSWSGTTRTEAKQVRISDLSLGNLHFQNLVLPSVDLSAIGYACGHQIDGILGIDLLRKIGAVLDLRDHTPRLRIATETIQSQEKELNERILRCEEGFNRRDEAVISDCLDPEVVVFSPERYFDGRASLMEVFRKRFLFENSARISLKTCVYHVLGEAIWVEYEFRTKTDENAAIARGSALWSNADGKWRIVHLNLSTSHIATIAVSSH